MNRRRTAPGRRGWALAGASIILGALVLLLALARPRRQGIAGTQRNAGAVCWLPGLKPALPFWDAREALNALHGLRWMLEVVVVVAVALWATGRYWGAPAGVQLSGGETEWITNSAQWAAIGLRAYGRIPLWQPWLEFGEPLIDNPVGFVLNPISAGPSLLVGAEAGLRWSVALTTVVAGVGGWGLGRALGLGWPGRVLLGVLLVGKGNMSAMFNTGYFQLAAQQAYFGWIGAGVVGVFRAGGARWPVVLLGVGLSLLVLAGNVWYTLPMAVVVGVVGLAYGIGGAGGWLDWVGLRRLALAGLVALGLSAMLLLPMLTNWGQVGRHPEEFAAGWEVPLGKILNFYWNPDPYLPITIRNPAEQLNHYRYLDSFAEFYYSFVVPAWFALLIFVLLPLYRPGGNWRLWLAAWGLLIVFTLWGAGGQPLFLWLYEQIPLLRGWRFVGRALAVGSFLIAVLVALRCDSLWRIVTETDWTQRLGITPGSRAGRWFGRGLAGILLVAGAAAGWQVAGTWGLGSNTVLYPIHADEDCIRWLRAWRPHAQLAIWRGGYEAISSYLNHRVRAAQIYAAFAMLPVPSTLGVLVLTRSLPEYGIAWLDAERSKLEAQGYELVRASPWVGDSGLSCLYHYPDALPYAYTVRLDTLLAARPTDGGVLGHLAETLPRDDVTPLVNFEREADVIALAVADSAPYHRVLTVQERAYPGWRVEINGQPARLESVGGQIGVLLPPDEGPFLVYFEFRPPLLLIGGWITLLTAAISIGWLLRAERIYRWIRSL